MHNASVMSASASKLAIEVSHLTKRYGELTAVNDISFTVPQGQIFAFLGPNGAGKTTTIKMLTTLLTPTTGNILIEGYSPRDNQDAVRRSFGIVFQDGSLDEELTAAENMEYHGVLYQVPVKLRRQRTKELLQIVELWDRRHDLVKTFSGGMRRRLEIARGLLHHPKIFFLDEPTVGLDPQTRNKIWEYIKLLNQKEGITIFLTTHYMEEAEKMASAIAIIDHGQVVAQGNLKSLLEKTHTKTLEAAFLALTGNTIREEQATATDHLKMMRRMHQGRRS